jgi:capsular polysaccharide export protein
MLNSGTFSERDLDRARTVRRAIVEHGITKYNVERRDRPSWADGSRPVILVPGQVEDDASIQFGCADVRTNLQLLAEARAAEQNALLVYKPHPDVVSRNRFGDVSADQVRQYADVVETELSVISCIEACDSVHTMTSLTGFDALLRGKPVITYGRPFYAGWGLTTDRLTFARRGRNVTLDMLVAGALLHYPLYWDWALGSHTSCEATIRRIVERREELRADRRFDRLTRGRADQRLANRWKRWWRRS